MKKIFLCCTILFLTLSGGLYSDNLMDYVRDGNGEKVGTWLRTNGKNGKNTKSDVLKALSCYVTTDKKADQIFRALCGFCICAKWSKDLFNLQQEAFKQEKSELAQIISTYFEPRQ